MDYEQLPEHYKESNRATVRGIPKKLAAAGYVMIPSRSNDPPFSFPGADLERLAELEHELWLESRLADGWQPGQPVPEDPKRHPNLVPWNAISEAVKQSDRDSRHRHPANSVSRRLRHRPSGRYRRRRAFVTRRTPVCAGVTGHRVLAEIDRVTAGIDDALNRVAAVFADRPVTVVSSLAEGADRLVAERALTRPDAALIAVLPLPPDEYECDFEEAASRDEFRRLLALAAEVIVSAANAGSREAAYERAGRAVLDRSDVLIAVWDGEPSQGPGGTADIVAEARARRLPLAWIRAGNRKPGTGEATSLAETQGLVTWEHW